MKDLLQKLKSTGFFHICSSQVINNIIAFCSSIFITRLLTKSDYGIYSAANNTISIFMLLNGLGTISGMLQFGSEAYNDTKKKNSYLRYGFRIGNIFNIVTTVVIVLYALFIPLAMPETKPWLLLMSLMPAVSYVSNVIATKLRIELRNKAYSYFNTGSTVLVLIATLTGAYAAGISGVIAYRYVAYILAIIVILVMGKDIFSFLKQEIDLTKTERSLFLKVSVISSVNNGLSSLLSLLDVFLVGEIIRQSTILAAYKAGSLIPLAVGFIPQAIVTYIYPYFARHSHDLNWFRDKYTKILKLMILGNLVISALLIIFAPLIVHIVFGKQYSDSVFVFRVLSVGYFFTATFRIPSGNLLVVLKKLKFNLYVCVTSGVLNILLDLWLIRVLGSVGAAFATLVVYILSGLWSTLYLQHLLKKGTESVEK